MYDHLHEKISLTNMARLLHTNPNYISNLFVRCEGISFTDFGLREKVALARNLLVYSQLSRREIASTLGFSSQSPSAEKVTLHSPASIPPRMTAITRP